MDYKSLICMLPENSSLSSLASIIVTMAVASTASAEPIKSSLAAVASLEEWRNLERPPMASAEVNTANNPLVAVTAAQ